MGRAPRFALPLFLTARNKPLCAVAAFAVGLVLYSSTNRLTEPRARLLPMTPVDRAIPFVPETFWIYVSECGLFVAALLLSRDAGNLNRYVYAMMAAYAVGAALFLAWPTRFPRDDFPMPADLDPATRWAFTFFRDHLDTPANCCPSLHVASCYLTAFLWLGERRRLFPWFFAWATAVGLSTLTTKQHYAVDIVAGLLYAALFYALFFRWVRYRLTPTQQPSPSGTITL